MVAENLISSAVLPLRTSDSGKAALASMENFNVRHLPIVNDQQLLGVISENDILIHNTNEPIGSYQLSLLRAYVKATGEDVPAEVNLPGKQTGSPMTYLYKGKQYVVLAVTTAGEHGGGELIAYALP